MGRLIMGQRKLQKETLTSADTISKALSSIYTGVFFIDLKQDKYQIVSAPDTIYRLLEDIQSAQEAINFAIEKTVAEEELIDMLTFVNLFTLPKRMNSEKFLNIEYKGIISGWVRGSFIEAKRDKHGHLVQALYTYQIIDETKRKELDHLQELKNNYIAAEKQNQETTTYLRAQKRALADDLRYYNDFTKIVMEQIDCGIMVYTVPGRNLLEINKEALRIHGWKDIKDAQEKMLKKWQNITYPNEEDKKKLFSLRTEDGFIKYKFIVDAGDKNEKYVVAKTKSLKGRHGGKVIVSTFMDVTHMTSLEADKVTLTDKNHFLTNVNVELQRARDAVYTILNSGSYICTYDNTGQKLLSIRFSDALRRLYGYSNRKDAPDTWETWIRGIYPKDKKRVLDHYLKALSDKTGNTDYDVTYRALRKDGSIRWHRAAGHILRRSDGTADTCYGFVMDIDEQKKTQDKVKEALKQAKLANEAKTSFLSRMSHDIRTPMNGIMGLIEINEKHADDIEFTTKNRQKAKIAADHLLSLINDVLQLSKLEDSEIELTEIPFDIHELCNDIYTIVEMRAHENGITINRMDEKNIKQHPYLWGSPLHVRQIYLNILSNAIKYNKRNGSIFCHAAMHKMDEEHILFRMTIKDTGIGMSEEFLKHLFEPFAREHEEMEAKRQGTGLGMAIVKQLVDKMDGTIEVESNVMEGSCFIVEIPFKIASEEDIKKATENEEKGEIDLNQKHILLVEDNELNMDIAQILLEDAGAKITKATNGQMAVDIYKKSKEEEFDVILMDVMMPIMNGYEATKHIRSLERVDAKKIPIIAMTANAFTEDVQKAKEAGMNDHLSKPLDVKKMLSVITKHMKS